MSLLIKALHKAEQGKVSDNKTAKADLLLELMPVGEPSPASIAQQQHSGQKAATTMFAAKNVQANNSSSKKMLLIAGVSLLVLALIGMQFYSYLNSLNQPQLALAKPALMPPAIPTALASVKSSPDLAQPTPEPVTTGSTAAVHVAESPAASSEKLDNSLPATKVVAMEKVAAHGQIRQRQPRPAKSEQLVFCEPVTCS